MPPVPPGSNPAIEAARAALLAWLDRVIAGAPAEWRPGLKGVRDQIATNSAVPAELVGMILAALGDAFVKGDFGPATGSDSDHA